MRQQLETMMDLYQPMQMQRTQERERIYNVGDLESLSASVLYSGDSGSSGSGFVSASNFGLGPGIAKESGGFIERYRAPGAGDSEDADHINLEYLVPGKKTESGKQKWVELSNIHIPLSEE